MNEFVSEMHKHGDVWCMDTASLSRFVATGNANRTPRIPKVKGNVAVIPLQGVITKRGGFFSEGTDRVLRSIQAAVMTKSIGGVVLDVDSPGGSSAGLQEFADAIYNLRGTKPIIAVANTMAASAAYWSATAADQMIMTPSGEVGSVGVWSLHLDESGLLEQMGIKAEFVYAGKYKIEGNPLEPLGDEARQQLQREVDEVYDAFIAALSRNRGVSKSQVRSDFGEGRLVTAKGALAANMVDRVATLDDVIAGMSSGSNSRSTTSETILRSAWEGKDPEGVYVEAKKRRREREHSRV